MSERELPEGWCEARLDELCDINPPAPRGVSDDTEVSFVPMAAVSDVGGQITGASTRPVSEVRKGFVPFIDNDVLFAKITPCMENGKSAVARNLTAGVGYGSTEFYVLRSRGAVIPEYIHRFVRQASFRQQAKATMNSAVGQARVPREFLSSHQLPVPPVPEQKRIVARLDALQARSRAAREALDDVPDLLDQLRQSVLAAAFRGDLTAEWRANNLDVEPASVLLERIRAERRQRWEAANPKKRYKEPNPADREELPELPDTWTWARAEELTDWITKGTTPAAERMSSGSGERPFIKVYNLTFDGTLDFSVSPTFVSDATHRGELARSRCFPGDVLMNIVGPPLGKVSVVPNTASEWNFNQAIAVFRPIDGLIPTLLAHYLLSGEVLSRLQQDAKATAGQFNLTLELCRDIVVPLCPLLEQRQVLECTNRALAFTSATLGTLSTLCKDLTTLDQAILARAFRGELVEQDPNDEPAKALLARIRAERVSSGKPTTRKGRG